jgi:hypothetical protein
MMCITQYKENSRFYKKTREKPERNVKMIVGEKVKMIKGEFKLVWQIRYVEL